MDEILAQQLESIDWFKNGGAPFVFDVPFPIEAVFSLSEALERCADPLWEDCTLEARNRLTAFLHKNYPEAYLDWNMITAQAKERVVLPLSKGVWRSFAKQNNCGDSFIHSVQWDVLTAIMEHEYKSCAGRPCFFQDLLKIYKAGHFPCGWEGNWPTGRLVVW